MLQEAEVNGDKEGRKACHTIYGIKLVVSIPLRIFSKELCKIPLRILPLKDLKAGTFNQFSRWLKNFLGG